APGLAWAYQRKSPMAVALYVALLTWWTVLQAFALRLDSRSLFWIGNVGAILILFAEAHRPRDPRGVPYRFWGVLMVSGILLALGSREFWRGTLQSDSWFGDYAFTAMLTEVIANLILLAISALLLFVFRGVGAFDLKGEAAEIDSVRRRWFAIILVGSLMLMSVWSLTIANATVASIVPIILANLVTLGMALYLVKVGEQEERTRPFAAGVLMFLMWTLVRYIDLFGGSGGLLGAALVFALCGGGLVVVGNFWSRKRRVLQAETTARPAETLTTTTWVSVAVEWWGQHRTSILICSAIGQVGLLGGMILLESLPLMIGQRYVLRVTPIDPRDYFRGDYVILNYDVNRLVLAENQGPTSRWMGASQHYDENVYVILEPEGDGVHSTGTTASLQRPAAGKYLRGRIANDYRQPLQFGIEAFYVQEGKGKAIEDLMRSKKLSAEIAVAPWGQAKLVRVYAD
ncbi:MAG: GDYXXLXY domain-containing protein, partial [Planctomycetota bacterium]